MHKNACAQIIYTQNYILCWLLIKLNIVISCAVKYNIDLVAHLAQVVETLATRRNINSFTDEDNCRLSKHLNCCSSVFWLWFPRIEQDMQ